MYELLSKSCERSYDTAKGQFVIEVLTVPNTTLTNINKVIDYSRGQEKGSVTRIPLPIGNLTKVPCGHLSVINIAIIKISFRGDLFIGILKVGFTVYWRTEFQPVKVLSEFLKLVHYHSQIP